MLSFLPRLVTLQSVQGFIDAVTAGSLAANANATGVLRHIRSKGWIGSATVET